MARHGRKVIKEEQGCREFCPHRIDGAKMEHPESDFCAHDIHTYLNAPLFLLWFSRKNVQFRNRLF